MPEIGAALREARMRGRIDLSEIEAETKIRARYLRALENEEWDLLPGPTFVKTFLRTYASALGLDGKALVEEYRTSFERPRELEGASIVAPRARGDGERRGSTKRPRGYLAALVAVAIVIVLLVIGLLTRGSSHPVKASHKPVTTAKGTAQGASRSGRHGTGSTPRHSTPPSHPSAAKKPVTVSLQASGAVWVCLVGERADKLIPGVELQAGETSGPYKAKRFAITLGNNNASLSVNGTPVSVPASTTAIGYVITSAGAKRLPPADQPTCQ